MMATLGSGIAYCKALYSLHTRLKNNILNLERKCQENDFIPI